MYKILYIQTIFPTKSLHLKIKIQHQHIHKPKRLRRNLLELTSNTATNLTLKEVEQDKTLSMMYWLPKMHKTPLGARLIFTSKKQQC